MINRLSESFIEKWRFLVRIFYKRWRNPQNVNLERPMEWGLEIPRDYVIERQE